MTKAPEPPPPPLPAQPARLRRWTWRLLWLTPLSVGIAGAATAATIQGIPDWGRWALAGTALAGISILAIAVLIGPAARRLAGERHLLTQGERQQMTVTERVEAVNAARHTLLQATTGLVVIGGVVFTAQGLWYTAQSLDASRETQRTAEQGQITDRYTKAVEQLGSNKLDVRLGGLYALERLAQDSPRDYQTVYDVLAAFVREHDPKPDIKAKKLPMPPATDVQAALTLISRRSAANDMHPPDLDVIRVPGARLMSASLSGAQLFAANLRNASLTDANLSGAVLLGANLSGAVLSTADLSGTKLSGANLRGASMFGADLSEAQLLNANLSRANLYRANLTDASLYMANLTSASLSEANLTRASLYLTDLSNADLSQADLRGANLSSADLRGADLRGADLREVLGLSESKIRKVATVDGTTIF